MIRALLDANAIASGVLGADRAASTPGAVWRAWRMGAYELVTSKPLIAEVRRTLGNAYFASRITTERRDETFARLEKVATLTPITEEVTGVASHPADDLVLAAAVSAGAGYLVTGDAQLRKLGIYRGVAIVTPREFLDILERPARDEARPEDADAPGA